MGTNPMAPAPVGPEPMFVKNPRLKSLMMILIFTFIASGAGLALTIQIQNYQQDQVYLATVAALPVHHASKPAIQPPTDLAGWQTYKNDQYGFELQYPADWKFQTEKNFSQVFDFVSQSTSKTIGAITLQIEVYPHELSLDDIIRSQWFGDPKYPGIDSFKEAPYASFYVVGIRYSGIIQNSPGSGDFIENIVFKSPDGNQYYQIGYEITDANNDSLSKILTSTASTFKFTK